MGWQLWVCFGIFLVSLNTWRLLARLKIDQTDFVHVRALRQTSSSRMFPRSPGVFNLVQLSSLPSLLFSESTFALNPPNGS